ncbi:MAG: ABC transporter permease [Candidatus Saccharibacteria bacterium]|nr:ABC transporter permease [Candidatus Saccharibacteria bacterium]
MKVTDIIRRAGRNLKRAKMRTFLTSVAIAVGGFAIMGSLMAGEGARQYIDRIISSNIDPQGLLIAKGDETFQVGGGGGKKALKEYNPDAGMYYGRDFKPVTPDDVAKLQARSDLKNVSPYYQLQPKYFVMSAKSDKKYTGEVMMRDSGIRVEVAAGKAMDKGVQLADHEAMVPSAYAEELGVSAESLIGTKLTLTVEQVPQKVSEADIMKAYQARGEAGVRELTSGKMLDKELTIVAVSKKSPDQATNTPNTYVSTGTAKELSEFATLGTDQYQKYVSVSATVVDGKNPEDVKKALKDELGLSAMTSKDVQGLLFTFVNVLQGIVMGFGLLALVVSVFGIINTMYISVLERTQQIGLMKALGASKRDIGRLFRYEAAWVGFLGGALGVLAAWGIGTALNPWISKSIGLGEHHLLVFQPLFAVGVVLVLMLVAIVAGFLPSRKAAKLDPIEALRTE